MKPKAKRDKDEVADSVLIGSGAALIVMVIAVLVIFGATSCFKTREPKYLLGEQVWYKVPTFYSRVCSGKGTVTGFGGIRTYRIKDAKDTCPYEFSDIDENEMVLWEK